MLLPPKEIASHIYHSWGSSDTLGHTDFDAFGETQGSINECVRTTHLQWQSLCPGRSRLLCTVGLETSSQRSQTQFDYGGG